MTKSQLRAQRKYRASRKGKVKWAAYMRRYRERKRQAEAEREAKIISSVSWRTEPITPESKRPSVEPLLKATPIDPYEPVPESKPAREFVMPSYMDAIERLRNTASEKWTPIE